MESAQEDDDDDKVEEMVDEDEEDAHLNATKVSILPSKTKKTHLVMS